MFNGIGECYVIEVCTMFNFKIFGYNIWPRFNDTFNEMVHFLDLSLMFKFKIYGLGLMLMLLYMFTV
jgi:hypothetical protein